MDDRYKSLQRFVEREGHALVPPGHKEDGLNLGDWVGLQRRAYRSSAEARIFRNSQAEERVALLVAISGWQWSVEEQ